MFRGVRQARLRAWLLIAAVILLRAGLPTGWMPVHDAEGIRVALCTSAGPAFITLTRNGESQEHGPGQASDPCPFGLLTTQAGDVPPPLSWAVAPIAPRLVMAPLPDAAARVIRRTALPPARGPPALA